LPEKRLIRGKTVEKTEALTQNRQICGKTAAKRAKLTQKGKK